MPNLSITISKSSGTPVYTKTSNGGATVSSDGTIDFRGQSANAYDVQWTLDASFGTTTFATTNAFTVTAPTGLFGVVSGAGTSSLTVDDDDVDNLDGYEYSLNLSDGTTLDPRFINR